MAASPYKSVISPVLVGRAVQLGAIEQSLGHSILGRGQTVLIAGEAGARQYPG
ncbi:MAG TPA: hypothetical protein VLQ48_16030 [Chloroflexia bacterium]|nr:hypothetical protein [Chloroflexia bacterium]